MTSRMALKILLATLPLAGCISSPLVVINTCPLHHGLPEVKSSDSRNILVQERHRFMAIAHSQKEFDQITDNKNMTLLSAMTHVPGRILSMTSDEAALMKRSLPRVTLTPDQSIHLAIPVEQTAVTLPADGQIVPWGVGMVQANQAWTKATGLGVKVCIMDTGIQKNHPDLVNGISGGRNFTSNAKGEVDPDAWDDDNGHGTHVAGVIAAQNNNSGVVGIAPDAKLHIVKVLNTQGSGQISWIIDGVYECIHAGAQVINMSLGSFGDPNEINPLHEAIHAAKNRGIIMVAAAGNAGRSIQEIVPAGFTNDTIAVSALDEKLAFPPWTNYGLRDTDFTAPGVKILSTFLNSGYSEMSGTSMAAPHVSGIAALALSAKIKTLRGRDIGGSPSYQGAGLIDAWLTLTNSANESLPSSGQESGMPH